MKNINLKELVCSKIVIFIFYCILFLNNCYLGNGLLSYLVNIFSLILSIFTIFCYLIDRKYSKFSVLVILFFIIGFISTYLGTFSTIQYYLVRYLPILSITLYTEIIINYKNKNLIKPLKILLFILITINFFTIVYFPNGLYGEGNSVNNWFLKYDNCHIFTYLPAIMIFLIPDIKSGKPISFQSFILLSMITYSVYFCFSATTVIAYTIVLFYILFRKKIEKSPLINPKVFMYIYILIFVFVVILRFQNIFSWLIVDILGKDLTFTNRTVIWDNVINYIKLHPIIGYGFEDALVFSGKMGAFAYTHAHNTLLDIWYKGGIFLVLTFMLILVTIIKKLYVNKDNNIVKFISVLLLAVLVMINFEAREDRIGLFLLFSLANNINIFIDDKNMIGS